MFTFNFGRKIRRVARRQYRHNLIDYKTYQKVKTGSYDLATVQKWQEAIEQRVPGAPWLRKDDTNWVELLQQIWEWLIENWPAILEIILTLLVFVEPPPKQVKRKKKITNKSQKVVMKKYKYELGLPHQTKQRGE